MCSPKEVYLRGFTLLGKWLMVWYHNTDGVLWKKPTCLRISSECRNPLVVSLFGTILKWGYAVALEVDAHGPVFAHHPFGGREIGEGRITELDTGKVKPPSLGRLRCMWHNDGHPWALYIWTSQRKVRNRACLRSL